MSEQIWYRQDSPAAAVVQVGKELWSKQGEQRISLAEDSLSLYLGSNNHSLRGGGSNPLGLLSVLGTAGSSYNLIQAITDTKIAAILKNKVRPMFVTEGADSTLKRKAKDMQAACDGLMYQLGMDGMLRTIAASCGFIFEAGGIEWYPDVANSRVVAAPVWPWEYFVSRREARYGNPRQLWARHAIDRGVLLSYLANEPKKVRDAVENAPAASWRDVYDDTADTQKISDQVIIYKAWHLPSGRVDLDDPRAYGKSEDGSRGVKPNHDGRHVVALDFGDVSGGIELLDIPWPHDHFPVSWFKPNYVPGSWWSRGEPEVLAPAQIELNRWNDRITKIVNLHAVPKWFVDKRLQLDVAQFNNNLANIFQTNGSPQGGVWLANVPAIPPDLLRRLQDIPQWARDQRGMSEMSMTAKKPPGINHEPGLAYLSDTESQRHTVEFEAWEQFNLDGYKNLIRCLRDLAEDDPKFELVFEKDKELTRERWKDIDLGNVYQMKLWPTNLFKQSPAQRADQIGDFSDRGWISPKQAMRAVDAPDLEAIMGDEEAMSRNVDKMLDRICDEGYTENEYPTPYIDLQYAKAEGIKRYNSLMAEEASFVKVNELCKFLEDVDTVIQQAASPAAPPPPVGDAMGVLGPAAALPPPGSAPMPPPGGAPPRGAPPPA